MLAGIRNARLPRKTHNLSIETLSLLVTVRAKVKPSMAVWAKCNGISDGVGSAVGKLDNMMVLKIRLAIRGAKRRQPGTELALASGLPQNQCLDVGPARKRGLIRRMSPAHWRRCSHRSSQLCKSLKLEDTCIELSTIFDGLSRIEGGSGLGDQRNGAKASDIKIVFAMRNLQAVRVFGQDHVPALLAGHRIRQGGVG